MLTSILLRMLVWHLELFCSLLFITSCPGIFNTFSELCDPQQDLILISSPNISIEILRLL